MLSNEEKVELEYQQRMEKRNEIRQSNLWPEPEIKIFFKETKQRRGRNEGALRKMHALKTSSNNLTPLIANIDFSKLTDKQDLLSVKSVDIRKLSKFGQQQGLSEYDRIASNRLTETDSSLLNKPAGKVPVHMLTQNI